MQLQICLNEIYECEYKFANLWIGILFKLFLRKQGWQQAAVILIQVKHVVWF